MPILAPQWTDYLNCPVCCREFGAPPRSPISLSCGHTICRQCLRQMQRQQCPYDQTVIREDPEEQVVNTALLQLVGYAPPSQPYQPPCVRDLPEEDREAYDVVVKTMEELAAFLKNSGNASSTARLSRPMQRKLVTLLQCSLTDEEGRSRAARAARSLGERTVTELILQNQNPQQLSANLWAAVRARGCQFLGPAMQEEVLKLVLLALEDGSALSRKVLVMFVVQRLEQQFPQASKTSIGHVVQLLYRASCFKVSKRESDSSLMQLKEEFRTYDSLRREHDAQIVQIATESGLRIAPDQWSALLYGDTLHKSHMQSIIDKLQTPQSFAQSVQELFIALQRTGDCKQLVNMSMHLDKLANIDASAEAKPPTWRQMADVVTSLKEVLFGLINYVPQQPIPVMVVPPLRQNNPEPRSEPSTSRSPPQPRSTPPPGLGKYKAICKFLHRSACTRGASCKYTHTEEEAERYRHAVNNAQYNWALNIQPGMGQPGIMGQIMPGHTLNHQQAMPFYAGPMDPVYGGQQAPPVPLSPAQPSQQPPQRQLHSIQTQNISAQVVPTHAIQTVQELEEQQENNFMGPMMGAQGIYVEPAPVIPEYGFQPLEFPGYAPDQSGRFLSLPNHFNYEEATVQSPTDFRSELRSDIHVEVPTPTYPPMPLGPRPEITWPMGPRAQIPHVNPGAQAPTAGVFSFGNMRDSLPAIAHPPREGLLPTDRRAIGAERGAQAPFQNYVPDGAEDKLEEELLALERRIDTEFKSAD